MKLTKLIVSIATIAIVSEITRRIVEEYEYRKINEELFEFDEEEDDNMIQRRIEETAAQKAAKERKEAIKALKAEQDYHLATIQYAIYETQEPDVVTEAKARLIEIHHELEHLK